MSATRDGATNWAAIESLFADLYDLPENEQRSRLDACASPDVRAAVERLLSRHTALEAGALMDPLSLLDVAAAAELLEGGTSETGAAQYRIVSEAFCFSPSIS